jgi:3-oxoacyl-[acyl-carrier-protein] synthase III
MTIALAQTTGSVGTKILSVGSFRPARVVTNAEICARIDSTDEWIQERSGIVERRWAGPDVSVVDMATAAAEKAMASSGISAEALGMVIVATVTHPYVTPSAAAEVQDRIGAANAASMDLSAACAGFSYAVALASDLVRCGTCTHVLVVGVEKLSDWIDHDDRGTAFLFADGAGAVVIGPSDVPGIGPVVWGSDGSQKEAITMTQSFTEYRDEGGEIFPAITMQGQQVFRWAVTEMSKAAQAALDAAGITADQLDAFIPHQANNRITDALVRALALPDTVAVARDITHMGNTSAASIPLAMDALLESGKAPRGGTALLIGFGAGLVFAAQVVTLP